jgi:hypothetical protein
MNKDYKPPQRKLREFRLKSLLQNPNSCSSSLSKMEGAWDPSQIHNQVQEGKWDEDTETKRVDEYRQYLCSEQQQQTLSLLESSMAVSKREPSTLEKHPRVSEPKP